MRSPLPLVSAVVVLLAAVSPAVAAGAPLVDAGLDQHAAVGDTVHLDAGGSLAPGGRIVRYEWAVRDADGTRVPVDGGVDGRATFRPVRPGRYTATVTATAADGTTGTDSLRVDVRAAGYATSGDGALHLAISGPTTATVGAAARYRAVVLGPTNATWTVAWRVDGRTVETDRVVGRVARTALTRRFAAAGPHRVGVTVSGGGRTVACGTAVDVVARSVGVGRAGTAPVGLGGGAAPATPTVTGPRRLTGAVPYRATYRVNATAPPFTDWYLDGRRVGRGSAVSLALSPGVHRLHAEWATARGVVNATFRGNETRVVAGPKPTLDVRADGGVRSLDVNATAADVASALGTLTVRVDGQVVARASGTGQRHLALNEHETATVGVHRVVVTARTPGGRRARRVESVAVYPWPTGV